MTTVLCINAKGKPAEVPSSQWIAEGEIYNVVKVMKCLGQGGILAYELEEVKIDAGLYKYFAASRFVPVSDLPEKELEIEELITA